MSVSTGIKGFQSWVIGDRPVVIDVDDSPVGPISLRNYGEVCELPAPPIKCVPPGTTA